MRYNSTVKVLYALDTSSHSYVTILNDRQDVYVHPNTAVYNTEDEQGLLGSCYLKSIAQGVCFARYDCSRLSPSAGG